VYFISQYAVDIYDILARDRLKYYRCIYRRSLVDKVLIIVEKCNAKILSPFREV